MPPTKPLRPWLLAPFLLAVGAVAAFAARFRPGTWYAALDKPWWTPPDWLFAPVWSALYLAIAVSGWLIFARGAPAARLLWTAQLVLNGAWSWLFFGEHLVAAALIDITALTACVLALLALVRNGPMPSFWLLLPYGLWVSYAWSLNAGVLALNS